ncbi:Acg family FMN-binding oxidoreductase [Nocardia miyunensis]|uniref:Acg family FMN-binding oxidoreductase n=1 Tax=Nocardia miyunensis TaxID=282684 RepID=UPI00083500E1|nr:NAD(P)H nitroreductase [Nocardia miyunensis]
MTTLPVDIATKAVRSAGLAPSLHNSQPWRWVFDGTQLDLHAVPERMLPTTDPTGRQMVLSCGIALGHLRTASTAAGWSTVVAHCPDPNRRTHLATVRFAPRPTVTDADRDRAEAIRQRYTNRLPMRPPTGWADFETVLHSTFDPADAILDVIPETGRAVLAHASGLTAALRYRDAEYQSELMWWTGTSEPETGIPESALLTADERARVPIGRSFPLAADRPRRDAPPDAATVLVLSTDSDGRADLLRGGEVLSTVLLECTAAGYATCVLTHLTEYSRSRDLIRDLIADTALPQSLIRVGLAAPDSDLVPRTPRLALSEILQVLG